MKYLYACMILLALTACGGGKAGTEARLYTLNPPPADARIEAPKARTGKVLAVMPPEARTGLDSRRIALRRGKTGFNYFAGARWEGPLPDMLHPLLIESLEHTGRFRAVIAGGSSHAEADYVLVPEIRALEAVYAGENVSTPPLARASLTGRLYTLPSHRLMASLPVTAEIKASDARLDAIVTALDEAWQQAAAELATRIAEKIR